VIEVDYNEYKETTEENMKLIQKNHKLKEEIERLNADLGLEKDNNEYLNSQLEKRDNIIKEVRERMLNENKPLPSPREIIEILDKVEEKK
jgi:hypothetical protein